MPVHNVRKAWISYVLPMVVCHTMEVAGDAVAAVEYATELQYVVPWRPEFMSFTDQAKVTWFGEK